MPTKVKIVLDDYERVDTEEELEGYSCVILTPYKTEADPHPAPIYLRREPKGPPMVVDTENVMWFPDARISNRGTPEEYRKRVDWWFEGAKEDPEFKKFIAENYGGKGFDIKASTWKCYNTLKMKYAEMGPSGRKTHIKKFYLNWLSKGFGWFMDKKAKNRNYNK